MTAKPASSSLLTPKLVLGKLKKRHEFVAVRKGVRAGGRFLVLQSLKRHGDQDMIQPLQDGTRIGYTVSKQNGNAVERNRIRRRLREAARIAFADAERTEQVAGTDFVIMAKREALNGKFSAIVSELAKNLDRTQAFGEKAHNKSRKTHNRGNLSG